MYCKKCGFKLETDSNFCDKCGTKVEKNELEEIINTYEEQTNDSLDSTSEKNSSENNRETKEIDVERQVTGKIDIDISDLKPDDIDVLIPKKNPIKVFLSIVIILVLIFGFGYLALNIRKKEIERKSKEIDYQQIIDEYAKSIEEVSSEYLLEHEIINDFSEISNLVKYDKHKVSCDNIFINIDGTVYLSECSIDGKEVEEVYGKKKSIITKDSDACHIDYDQEENKLEFFSDGVLVSVYECDNYKCSQYKTEEFEYNSCLDNIAVIQDGNYKYLYNYQAGQEVIDKLDEIVAIIDNDKYIGFIVKDSNTEKYGYVDTRGIIKLELKYDTLGLISNGKVYDRGFNLSQNKITASMDGKYGVIDFTNGKEIIPFKYDNIYLGSKDKYVIKEDKKYYLIDSEGKKLLEDGYDMIFSFDSLLIVSDNDKLKFIDYDGKKIIDDELDLSVDYKEEAINGIFGYNAYLDNNKIIIEINSPSDSGYETITYTYDINSKKLSKND